MKMKISVFLFTISVLSLFGCSNTSKNVNEFSKEDTICIVDKQDDFKTKEEQLENTSDLEDMISISTFFSTEEIDKIRSNYINQLRFNFQFYSAEDYIGLSEDELKNEEHISEDVEISDEEKSENMDVIYRILQKKNPILKPVSQDLYEEKMKRVFGIDVNDKNMCGSNFYTNQTMYNESTFAIYVDPKNRLVTLGYLPLSFEKECDWNDINKKLEKIDRQSILYCITKEKLYEEYLSEALHKKYTLYCSKSLLEFLFYINNYVFYENKASLSWLITHNRNEARYFIEVLFEFFNYDQEPRINKYMFDDFFSRNDVSKGYPLNTYEYKHIFGEVESCSQTDYYNHFQFKVRTGLMQYVVDNCYDDTDLDDCGLKKDKYICVMEDCFDYLFKKVLEGDKYKESENCHYYQTCAYLAYYLQKAYDNYVSHDDGQPRCWHNALANNLYEDIRNNDSRFENYVKENNYFNLDGFEEIMKDAHDQAMRE